ncbi:MAG: aromatic ring-hydroxylating oxygenase subunit alpha, partial [Gemmatimonadales bacterium]
MATFLKRTEILTESAMTLPGHFYKSPEVFGEEMEKIFGQRWLCVGREDRLTEPGEYFVQSIEVEEALVLRDQSGRLRAFYNVCRHRGTRLCEARSGKLSGTILCPYHSWAYSLDGRLVGAPSTNDIPGFDKADYPLHQIPLRTWQGFAFISLAQDPPPFEEMFEGLDDRASLYNLSNLKLFQEIVYDVNANWKL